MKVNRKIQPLPVRDTAVEVAINHWEQKHLPLSSPSPLPPDATPSHKVKIKNLGEMTHDSRPPTSNVIQATLISMCVSVTHQYFRSCHKDFFFFFITESFDLDSRTSVCQLQLDKRSPTNKMLFFVNVVFMHTVYNFTNFRQIVTLMTICAFQIGLAYSKVQT